MIFAAWECWRRFLEGRRRPGPTGLIAHRSAGRLSSARRSPLGSGASSTTRASWKSRRRRCIPSPAAPRPSRSRRSTTRAAGRPPNVAAPSRCVRGISTSRPRRRRDPPADSPRRRRGGGPFGPGAGARPRPHAPHRDGAPPQAPRRRRLRPRLRARPHLSQRGRLDAPQPRVLRRRGRQNVAAAPSRGTWFVRTRNIHVAPRGGAATRSHRRCRHPRRRRDLIPRRRRDRARTIWPSEYPRGTPRRGRDCADDGAGVPSRRTRPSGRSRAGSRPSSSIRRTRTTMP